MGMMTLAVILTWTGSKCWQWLVFSDSSAAAPPHCLSAKAGKPQLSFLRFEKTKCILLHKPVTTCLSFLMFVVQSPCHHCFSQTLLTQKKTQTQIKFEIAFVARHFLGAAVSRQSGPSELFGVGQNLCNWSGGIAGCLPGAQEPHHNMGQSKLCKVLWCASLCTFQHCFSHTNRIRKCSMTERLVGISPTPRLHLHFTSLNFNPCIKPSVNLIVVIDTMWYGCTASSTQPCNFSFLAASCLPPLLSYHAVLHRVLLQLTASLLP